MELWREIELARKRIRKAIRRTPLVYSDTFSKMADKEVYLKLENLQTKSVMPQGDVGDWRRFSAQPSEIVLPCSNLAGCAALPTSRVTHNIQRSAF